MADWIDEIEENADTRMGRLQLAGVLYAVGIEPVASKAHENIERDSDGTMVWRHDGIIIYGHVENVTFDEYRLYILDDEYHRYGSVRVSTFMSTKCDYAWLATLLKRARNKDRGSLHRLVCWLKKTVRGTKEN